MKKYIVIASILIAAVLLVPFFMYKNRESNENTLEIFSWWTAGGEAEGLQELYRLYNGRNPDVEIINATVTGGAGYNARAVLETRMRGGNPPDSFQIHAGPGLITTWVESGLLEPITFLYEEQGWFDVFPAAVIEKITHKEKIYAVPVNIHRANLLWFNREVFERYNVQPPKDMEQFFLVAEKLAESGRTPLALGDKNGWPALHLMESIIISVLGAEKYKGLWTGETAWDSREMETALTLFLQALQYTNTDHAALTWDESVQYVIDEKCAMICIGDFAEGYFKARGLNPGEEFGWVPFPGSSTTFAMISDTFVLPRGAQHRDNAVEWLTLLGSKSGQHAFNLTKGSIPARTDISLAKFDAYINSAQEAFSSNEVVGSFTHGAAAHQEWLNDLTSIAGVFVVEKDINRTIRELAATAEKHTQIQ